MNILAPIDNSGEIPVLCKMGANEFFCGYIPEQWLEKYSKSHCCDGKWREFQISLNKRENMSQNVSSLDILRRMVLEAERFNASLFLTLNATSYPSEAYPDLDQYVHDVLSVGIHGLIVTDIGLVKFIRANYLKAKLILSTCQLVTNCYSNRFFEKMGIQRITFPRNISLPEMVRITKSIPNMEYECFIIDGKCIYEDSNCRTIHNAGMFCIDQWDYQYYRADGAEYNCDEMNRLLGNEATFRKWSKGYPSWDTRIHGWSNARCGICALPTLLNHSNITSLKIAGRGCTLAEKCAMVQFVRRAIRKVQNGGTEKELEDYGKSAFHIPEMCDNKSRCFMALKAAAK